MDFPTRNRDKCWSTLWYVGPDFAGGGALSAAGFSKML
jgi:hypothetical protein